MLPNWISGCYIYIYQNLRWLFNITITLENKICKSQDIIYDIFPKIRTGNKLFKFEKLQFNNQWWQKINKIEETFLD